MPRLADTCTPSPSPYNPTPQPDMAYYHHGRVPSLSGAYYDQPPVNVATTTAGGYPDPFAVSLPLTMPPSTSGLRAPSMMGSSSSSQARPPSNSSAAAVAVSSSSSAGGPGGPGGPGGNYMLQAPAHPPQHLRTSSGAWSPEDDDALLAARARGENWAQIHRQFHGKTANACRKRHERLMERRNADDFDTCKMEAIALAYVSMRREIWEGLAARTGEKWSTVEQKCMASGIKNLQSMARAAGRHRDSQGASAAHAAAAAAAYGINGSVSGSHHLSHHLHNTSSVHASSGAVGVSAYDDQDYNDSAGSGLSGGGMSSPGDDGDLDPAGGSSPGSSSSSGASFRRSILHHHPNSHSLGHSSSAHLHAPPPQVAVAPPVQDVGSPGSYSEYYTAQTAFPQSLRSMGIASQHPSSSSSRRHGPLSQHHSSLASPYMTAPPMNSDRISAADMGISSLIDPSTSRPL